MEKGFFKIPVFQIQVFLCKGQPLVLSGYFGYVLPSHCLCLEGVCGRNGNPRYQESPHTHISPHSPSCLPLLTFILNFSLALYDPSKERKKKPPIFHVTKKLSLTPQSKCCISCLAALNIFSLLTSPQLRGLLIAGTIQLSDSSYCCNTRKVTTFYRSPRTGRIQASV